MIKFTRVRTFTSSWVRLNKQISLELLIQKSDFALLSVHHIGDSRTIDKIHATIDGYHQ